MEKEIDTPSSKHIILGTHVNSDLICKISPDFNVVEDILNRPKLIGDRWLQIRGSFHVI